MVGSNTYLWAIRLNKQNDAGDAMADLFVYRPTRQVLGRCSLCINSSSFAAPTAGAEVVDAGVGMLICNTYV